MARRKDREQEKAQKADRDWRQGIPAFTVNYPGEKFRDHYAVGQNIDLSLERRFRETTRQVAEFWRNAGPFIEVAPGVYQAAQVPEDLRRRS